MQCPKCEHKLGAAAQGTIEWYCDHCGKPLGPDSDEMPYEFHINCAALKCDLHFCLEHGKLFAATLTELVEDFTPAWVDNT